MKTCLLRPALLLTFVASVIALAGAASMHAVQPPLLAASSPHRNFFIAPKAFQGGNGNFRVTSTTLKNNSFIPASMVFNQYSCTGGNTSPQLSWTQASGDVDSYAVAMYDVTANFTHWGVYNIPPYITELPENAGAMGSAFTDQVTNDFGLFGYDGPCPPAVSLKYGPPVHTYVITAYALDTHLTLNSPTDPFFPPNGSALFRAMIGHVLESASITGFFECTSTTACS
jgi:Raf kinase inhibitor-like YbhB/YbcL family protein